VSVWKESGRGRAKRDGKDVSAPVRRWTPDEDGVAQVDLAVGSRRLCWPPMGSVADAASPGQQNPPAGCSQVVGLGQLG
jgi:hypothetical protein